MDQDRFSRLTEGQKECLRLFHDRVEIKEIARRIGRTPETVNQRLALARRHLSVDRSAEAARLLVEHERGLCTPPVYGPNVLLGTPRGDAPVAPPDVTSTTGVAGPFDRIPLPFPTAGRPQNDLTFGGKVAWSLALAVFVVLVFGGAVAALNGLSELL